MMHPNLALRRQRGFTLIELMIAIAIIGILMRIAYPAYFNAVKKSRRSDAKTALTDLAQREERYLATANNYTDSAPLLGYSSGTVTASAPMSVMSGSTSFYKMSVTFTGASSTSAPAFTATATRQGSQTTDTQCGDLSLDNFGRQTVSNATSAAADCW